MDTYPTHYRDGDGQLCGWSGVARRSEDQPCPQGCSGSTEHYSNDGHPQCDDGPEELAKLRAKMEARRVR